MERKIYRLLDQYFPADISDIVYEYQKMKLFKIKYIITGSLYAVYITIEANSVEHAQYLAELISYADVPDANGYYVTELHIDRIYKKNIKKFSEKDIENLKNTIKSNKHYQRVGEHFICEGIVVNGNYENSVLKKSDIIKND